MAAYSACARTVGEALGQPLVARPGAKQPDPAASSCSQTKTLKRLASNPDANRFNLAGRQEPIASALRPPRFG